MTFKFTDPFDLNHLRPSLPSGEVYRSLSWLERFVACEITFVISKEQHLGVPFEYRTVSRSKVNSLFTYGQPVFGFGFSYRQLLQLELGKK
ncbi:hypothetical protein NPIL_97251 [Nephila pilipes]|uniref:Uncharacterized protein n=1 Tax=Nephila pilipes TaxID=299642 RepID=A0A8X6NLZ6_NEPPI|nr:hypothetical protein NPIL_97251 [Nephila pilipes]